MKHPAIVSIQSQLVFGCAGNNAAVPLLQRLGATVYAVPTTLLSNTPHFPSLAGGPVDPALIEDLLARLLDRVAPADIDAILTGYMGSEEAVHVAARFIDRVREAHPDVVVLCDPVMGDVDYGFYVDAKIADALMRELVPRATILTPNLFEARHITSSAECDGRECLSILLARGAAVAAITGIEVGRDTIRTLASDGTEVCEIDHPRLRIRPTGTGDIFSAGFLFGYLDVGQAGEALKFATETVLHLLASCFDDGAQELEPWRGC